MSRNSFDAKGTLDVGGRSYEIFRLSALAGRFDVDRLPFSLKILLENLLRNEDGVSVGAAEIEALAGWDPASEPDREIAFAPARILMQDFTGVPCVVDLAAMRDAMVDLGGDPDKVNPLVPGRAGDRPLGIGRQLRLRRRQPHEHRHRIRAQHGALRVPEVGADGLRQLLRRAAQHRASATRSTSSTWRGSCS